MQGIESRADDTTQAAEQPAPSAEGQAAPESRATLSEEARIESNLQQGIRNRLAGRSERPARETPARAQAVESDADDEDDDEDETSPPSGDAAPATPVEPPAQPSETAQPTDAPIDRSQLKGRALLRYDLKVANDRIKALEKERDDGIAAVSTERDEATRQLGAVSARYREIKPKEAAAILEENEFARLEYIEKNGGLTFDDQQRLDTARTLRAYRQVWIDDRDAEIAARLTNVKTTFAEEAQQGRERWGVRPEQIASAQSFGAVFETFAQAGYAKAKAEDKERISQLETDNTALSAQAAGRTAAAPALGGRSAPLDSDETPGPNATPEEKMRAGIRKRMAAQRNGRALAHA